MAISNLNKKYSLDGNTYLKISPYKPLHVSKINGPTPDCYDAGVDFLVFDAK